MHRSKTYHWLFFDADGTLFDYDRAEAKALQGTFQDFNLPFAPGYAGTYQEINHQVWLDFENGQITSTALRVARFERLFAALQMDTRVDTERFSARYLQNLAMASDLNEGAEKTIRALQGKYRLALITNGLKDVQRPRLAHSAIAGCFAEVAISEELDAAKPARRYFDRVFERIGQPARETVLVIGDSLSSDIQGGINYGLDTCWFNPQGQPANPKIPATYEIRRLEELLSLLD
jgi:2-haloacid dehalogenase